MALFKSKIGLIAATVGSAVGLGTVWRFPAETQANGGAAFLIVYIICLFALGVPVMLAEFALGRQGRSDTVGVFRRLSPGTAWPAIGIATIVVAYMIMSFYMVVGGWTLEYMFSSITGDLFTAPTKATASQLDMFYTAKMHQYVMTDTMPLIFTMVFVGTNIAVLLGGVQKGIERMSNVLMPLLFILLVGFCIVSLTLPGAGDGVKFFLSPDFSKISAGVVINALGQALFSLSLGMGILVTYASYFPDNTKLGRTSVIVVSLTLLVAVLMGLIIFPAVSSFGLTDHGLKGTTLVFVTLPEVFEMLPASQLWATLFFILLTVAALTSTVSLAEVVVRFMQERAHLGRTAAVFAVLSPVFALSALCSLSFGSLESFKICGMILFDFLDTVSNNYMLPLVALATCLYAGWFAPKGMLNNQFTNFGTIRAPWSAACVAVVRFVAPAAIVAILIGYIF